MAATAAEVKQLRRMTAEPTLENYDDDTLAGLIETQPLDDADGNAPTDADWTPTYDLNRTAALIWDEKAAKEADSYDFSQGSAGNATYKRSQLYTQAKGMARYLRSLGPVTSTELVIDRDDEEALKSKWGGYPALLIDPDPSHGGLFQGEFREEEGDF